MDRVFIRLPATAEDALQGVSCIAGHWQRITPWQDSPQLAQWAQAHVGQAVVVITPVGLDVAVVLAATPKQRREAGSGLVALAEDFVAEDYEQLHWVLESLDETQVLAHGIRQDWLSAWLQVLQAQGLNVVAAVPESSLLMSADDSWAWLPVGNEVFLQAGPGQAALVSRTDAPLLLDSLLAQRSLKTALRLRYPQGAELPELPEVLQPSPAPWSDWADLLKRHDSGYWARHPLNWLTGAMALKQHTNLSPWWRVAACVALGTLLLSTAMNRYEAHGYQQEANAAHSAAEQIYRSTFPEDRRVDNVRRQFAAKLQASGGLGPAQLLQLLAQTAPSPSWQVQRLDYHENGISTLEVSGNTLAEVQHWVSALNSTGLVVSLQNARLESGLAKASLTVAMAKRQG